MTVEGFEDGAQKSVGQQHARSGHIDNSNALLGCDGFEDVSSLRRAGGDASAFAGRIARVQYVDRNIFMDCGQHGRGVQNFCAEVRKFSGFVEADDFNAVRIGTDSGIGGEDAVDVGPYFDAFGAEPQPEDGGGTVGTPPPEGGSTPE